jgi:asparagine synthase (glutamine-hydrolysing)
MLSGGMDSGSVVAVASEILAAEGKGPLPTFSAISSMPDTCIESCTLKFTQSITGLEPYEINPEELTDSWSSILTALSHASEPFEMDEILVRCVYQLAKTQGVNVLLDGVPGDNVLSETGYIPRLVRNGNWLIAYREARLSNHFWKGGQPPVLQMLHAAGSVFAPDCVKVIYRRLIHSKKLGAYSWNLIERSGIRQDFARQVDLVERFRQMHDVKRVPVHAPIGEVTAVDIQQPYITAAIERYGRIAASLGMECRHPWMDRRLVELCVSLPGHQRLAKGWPKAILRKAMKGHLPDRVRYRRGKEHLGPNFSSRFLSMACLSLQQAVLGQRFILERYINEDTIESLLKLPCKISDIKEQKTFSNLVFLALWLKSRKRILWPNDPEK